MFASEIFGGRDNISTATVHWALFPMEETSTKAVAAPCIQHRLADSHTVHFPLSFGDFDSFGDQECGAAILHQGYHRLVLCRRRFWYDLSPEESHPTMCKM